MPGTFFSALSVLRKLGSVSVWGGVLATAIFWLRTGRRRPPSEDVAVAEAMRLGEEYGHGPDGDLPPPAGEPAGYRVAGGPAANGGAGSDPSGDGPAAGGNGDSTEGER